jgi:hypothetical protein
VDGNVKALLDQQIIDRLGILVFTGVCGAENHADTNGVLIDQINRLNRVNHVSVIGAIHILLLDVKVPCGLFPAHLHGAVHDDVRARPVLALGLALVLPLLLHGQGRQHDGLGRADGRRAHGVVAVLVDGRVEQARNHVDAAVLDVGRLRVLLVVDEVFAKGLGHELLGLVFLRAFSIHSSFIIHP